MADSSPQNGAPQKELGLGYWMDQVVAQAEVVRKGFEADPVHDLRVAIRRCRSVAEGFVPVDPHPLWKKMRKTAKPLFAALGELRDTQVLAEWVEKLGEADDPVRVKLLDYAKDREQQLKVTAEQRLADFDLKQWSDWGKVLEERAKQLPPGGDIFQIMTLQRWIHARELQATALRNRSKISLHALRIGLKKFRYMVENFLPELHERWHKDLKTLQDLLGEIHDFDVLWETAKQIHAFGSPDQRNRWIELIREQRRTRLEKYRKKMLGRESLWYQWRKALPEGEALHRAVLKYFETWSFFRDRDISHSRRVLQAGLSIYDSLAARGTFEIREIDQVSLRDILTVSALVHGVTTNGKAKPHKQVVRLLQRLEPPPGWSRTHVHIASLAARYHRGALPSDSQKNFAALTDDQKSAVRLLGGIIRLADSFDRSHDGVIQRINVTSQNGFMMIRAVGYGPVSRDAEAIAAARHLLESEVGIPIMVSAAR
jgi:CHAD domain-containing protein